MGNCTQNCGGWNELELQDSSKGAKLGCKFKAGYGEPYPSSCDDGSNQQGSNDFSSIAGARYFSNNFLTPDHTGINAEDCWENHCKDNCACMAAFWESKSNGSCFLIQGPVATIIFNASATKDEFMGYLKFMENATPPSLTKPIEIGVSVGVFVLIIAVFVGGGYVHRRRRLQARRREDYEIEKELLGDSILGSTIHMEGDARIHVWLLGPARGRWFRQCLPRSYGRWHAHSREATHRWKSPG